MVLTEKKSISDELIIMVDGARNSETETYDV